ncbi:MAG: DNA topoisomerase, partial [Lachnospiraceae bacterium]|nr:DNA topoisomerase [Lachnospiraceae bacterium]
YDMYELGIRYDRPYRKCARIVGDTMGKYHPHGDSSIYEALVVMAQEFKKGQALVDGHGNFGSIEGDGAAAMRYTEARLQKITQVAFLADLDKDVVDFVPNFDETEREPQVLPVRIPNLLVNGADGIAVGMVTSIPPHNLSEVIDAVKALIKNNKLTDADLMKYIKGPDFPTGGIVVNQDELLQIYETGQGKIRLRGRVEVEKVKGGRERLVITEIPYTMMGANIGKFLNDVASLVETKKTNDIIDISNQSAKGGIRIVLELRRGADVEKLKNLLYKKTRLQDTFGVNMLAVADGRPETLSLRKILEYNIDFQFELTTRKYKNLLDKEEKKSEIQEGLIRACDIIDLIIEILRGSRSRDQVKDCLVNGVTEGIRFKTEKSRKLAAKLNFTEPQANAILDMRLYKLIGLELEVLMEEHEQTLKNIASYRDILNSYASMAAVIIKELDTLKKEFGRPRRTSIENAEEIVLEEPGIEEIPVVFLMDRFGYVRTIDETVYERNKEAADAESRYVLHALNTDRVCVFTDTGKAHLLKMQDVPFGRFRDKGTPVDNLCNYNSSEETFIGVMTMNDIRETVVTFVTKQAMVKQVAGSEFDVSKRTTAATKLQEGDTVLTVYAASEHAHLVLASENGYFLRFAVSEIPLKKKTAVGVRGMKLADGDSIAEVYWIEKDTSKNHSVINAEKGNAVQEQSASGDGKANAVQKYEADYKGKTVNLTRLKLASRDTKGTRIRI